MGSPGPCYPLSVYSIIEGAGSEAASFVFQTIDRVGACRFERLKAYG